MSENGYPMEYHVVTTEDDYVLGIHRIPPKRTNGHTKKPYPVILVHGALMTSFAWLVMGPKKSLGYILADAGFDVWMINHRGCSYSKMHKTFPECSDEFWDFSWHEMGKYDLPAMVDYVIATTKMEKVDLIGFSLGGSIILVMGCTRPEYNAKVNVMHLMAPSMMMTKVDSKLRVLAYLSFSRTLRHLIVGDAHQFGASAVGRLVSSNFCKYPLLYKLCTIFSYTVYGFHEEKHDEDQLALFLKHIPDGTSTKTLIHLAQVTFSGQFNQFDMEEDNFEVYGQEKPPAYNVTANTAKVRFYFSDVDEGVGVDGIYEFARKLPSVIGMHERKHFRHQDYMFPMEEHVEQYREIIRNIKSDRQIMT